MESVQVDGDSDVEFVPRDNVGAPVLEPSNRRVRHLIGVSIRNISLASKTNNEENESFSTDMAAAESSQLSFSATPQSPQRPSGRRRGTTVLSEAWAEKRARELERQQSKFIMDTLVAFYSDSYADSEPFYCTELVRSSMNPSFREVDFSQLKCRNDTQLKVSVWVRPSGVPSSGFQLLIHTTVNLIKMEYVGASTGIRSFPTNTLLFELVDGIYLANPSARATTLLSRTLSRTPSVNSMNPVGSPPSNLPTISSVSFDTIMKIGTLENAIIDGNREKDILSKTIDHLLRPGTYFSVDRSRQAIDMELKQIRQARQRELRASTSIKEKIKILSDRLKIQREALRQRPGIDQKSPKSPAKTQSRLLNFSNSIYRDEANGTKTNDTDISNLNDSIMWERSRLADLLDQVFPIVLSDERNFMFTICGTKLENTKVVKDYDEDELAASYGFTCQLVVLLARYLNISLRYPVQPFGSHSFIVDPVSTIKGSRTFPLWTKDTLLYRFEYGSYLLLKDIEQLANASGLFVADFRQPLANLKNILLVLSIPKPSSN